MNAKRLLAHYEQIADAPDAISRLRHFILDLAVRGKLMLQDTKDEPAAELLKRIAVEKARLAKAGKLRQEESLSMIDEDAFPMSPPVGWVLARLAAISRRIHYGFTASADAALKDVRMLRITDIQDNAVNWHTVPGCVIDADSVDQYRLERGDVLIARTGGTIGKTFLVRTVPVVSVFASYLIRIQSTSHVFDEYLKLFLESPLYWSQLQAGTRGTGQPNVNGQTLGMLVVPLPPLNEQHRIVTKVDELMALCDRLETARTAREATRDRLAAASLARLNAPDPETFQADARFALDALPALTTRPDQINQLRQTILNLAVRGKLVPQDPNDAPAPVQLAHHATGFEDRLGSDIPHNWRWVRVEDVANARLGKMLDKAKNKGTQYPYLRNTNVHWFDIRLHDLKTIPLDDAEFEEYRLKSGDVLICEGGHGIGRAAVWRGGYENLVFQKALHRVRPGQHLDSSFFAQCCFVYFDAGIMQTYFTGVGIPHFTGRALAKLVFPLPPLVEQQRIVAKVDELMTLCDLLETSLEATSAIRRRLLDALLAEALAPAEERELEAVA